MPTCEALITVPRAVPGGGGGGGGGGLLLMPELPPPPPQAASEPARAATRPQRRTSSGLIVVYSFGSGRQAGALSDAQGSWKDSLRALSRAARRQHSTVAFLYRPAT